MYRKNATLGSLPSKSHVFSATKSEQFLAQLTTLGYSVQQHKLKPQHLDYFYDDKESYGFMEAVRTGIKLKNCVPAKDILRFKRLEDGNKIIVGKDLATEVLNIKKIQSDRTQRLEREIAERKELRRKLEAKQANIKKVEAHLAKIDDTVLKLKADESKRSNLENYLKKNENKRAQRDAVICSFQKLRKIVQRVYQEYQCYKDESTMKEFIWGLDWHEIIADWEELMQLNQKCIEECGNNLLFEDDDEPSTTIVPNIKRIFHQYSQHVERLKHVVIYSCLEKSKSVTKAFVHKASARRIRHVIGIAKRNSGSDLIHGKKLKDDLAEANALKKESLRQLKAKKLNTIRKVLARCFTQQIDLLTNFVVFEKTKLYRVIRFTLEILTNLRIEIFIVEQLMKSESRAGWELGDDIGKSYSELVTITKEVVKNAHRRFSPNDKALVELFAMFEIPSTVLLSFQSTWNNLAWIREEKIQNTNLALVISNSAEVNHNISEAKRKEKRLSNQWDSFKLEHFKNSSQIRAIRELEGQQEKVKNELRFYAGNRNQIIKESIRRKFGIIQEMKAQLSKIKMERAKLAENRRSSRSSGLFSDLRKSCTLP